MEPAPHIAVVDDHREIRELVGRYLLQHGYRVSAAGGAAEFRRLLENSVFDLVVLDIMMPGEDGLALCRHLRNTSDLPIILLTAMTEQTDRIIGLEMGADDYVTKPFDPRELLARIKSVLRRANSLPPRRGRAAERGRVPVAVRLPRPSRHDPDARPAARSHRRPGGGHLRSQHRQPGQSAAQEDRSRSAQSGADPDALGRRLQPGGRDMRRLMRRLRSASLVGQMVALLLLALGLSQAIGFFIYRDERTEALRGVVADEFISRAASVAQLLEVTPPTLHEQILRAFGTTYTRYWLAPVEPQDVASWQQQACQHLAEVTSSSRSPPFAKLASPDGRDFSADRKS